MLPSAEYSSSLSRLNPTTRVGLLGAGEAVSRTAGDFELGVFFIVFLFLSFRLAGKHTMSVQRIHPSFHLSLCKDGKDGKIEACVFPGKMRKDGKMHSLRCVP